MMRDCVKEKFTISRSRRRDTLNYGTRIVFLWKDKDKILHKVRGEVTNAQGTVNGNLNGYSEKCDPQVHIEICKLIAL